MNVEKLLKRFMKESGIYGANESKEVLAFTVDYDEAILPFNSFRWDTTSEGHNYWYTKAMEWVLYLYDNFENIDEKDKTEKEISINTIKDELYELMKYYCLENSNEEELMKINAYKNVKELYDKLNVKEPIAATYTIDTGFGSATATTTVSYTTA